jgi:hypothetical protein
MMGRWAEPGILSPDEGGRKMSRLEPPRRSAGPFGNAGVAEMNSPYASRDRAADPDCR